MRGSFFTIGSRSLFAGALTLAALIFSSCNYREDKLGADALNGKAGEPGLTALIDSKLIQTQVLNSCVSCHSGRTAPLVNSIDAIRAVKDRISTSVRNNSMPPQSAGYSPLSDCRKAILQAWLDAGTPDSSSVQVSSLPACQHAGPGPIEPPLPPLAEAPLNYDTLITRVIRPRCMNCHNPNDKTEAADTLFFPYSEIAGGRRWKAPGQTSGIVRILRKTDDSRMPPPEDGPSLSEEEISYIARWIDAGQPQ
ncbi:MAG: hypothetical protein IPJ84_09695 [Bdellovibrionales bacterium]|nr:hypothetical protein [Bdellovibrionales bacterium]